jgi:predicted kinase/phosphoglycolate phosphatase-like HAD superfamily hydrolase
MTEIILTRGLPGSGKSTYAREWVAEDPKGRVNISRDDIRMQLFGEWYPKTDRKEKEDKVTEVQHALIAQALQSGKKVMIDDTNLNPRVFSTFKKLASTHNVPLTHKDFPVSVEESIRRQIGRDKPVPADSIRKMAKDYLGPNGEFHLFPNTYPVKPFTTPDSRQTTIAFDADGTLVDVSALTHLVRGSYRDFDRFHRSSLWSPPNQEVVDLAKEAADRGFKVIVVTAREELYRDVTQSWMDKHGVPYENIFMRGMGDRRPDHIAKRQMFEEINKHYDVVHFVDDRHDIAEVWRSHGVETTLVSGGYGDGSFDEEFAAIERGKVVNPFTAGKCLKCGRPLKNGGFIGSECAKNA